MAFRRTRGDGSDAGDRTGDEPGSDAPRPVQDSDPDPAAAEATSDADETDDDLDGDADVDADAGAKAKAKAVEPDDDLDDEAAGPADTEGEGAGAGPEAGRRRRSVLDARTLVVCTLIALIAALAAGLLASRLIDEGDAQADPLGTLTPAEKAPDVALTRFDGSQTSLADYQGQPLVVNFWSTTCQPCVQEMPDLQAVHTSLGEDVAFLGVNTQDTPEAAQALADQTGVTYDLAQDVEGELSRALGVTTLPVTVLVLPDGTVVDTIHRQVSSERLCEKINQSLLGGSLQECG